MAGHILLAGGAEFGGRMAEVDQRAFTLAGGYDIPVVIIPAAAAPDNNHQRAGANGVHWFAGLGGRRVALLPIIDPASAANPDYVSHLAKAGFIYLLGGFPGHLWRTLQSSPAWQAILEAYQGGAVIGGSSAGAMVLCQHFYDPYNESVREGLNLIRSTCILPHHNNFGKRWARKLMKLLPDILLLGIDEGTGVLDDGSKPGGITGSKDFSLGGNTGEWNVYGAGSVTLYRQGDISIFRSGDKFNLG